MRRATTCRSSRSTTEQLGEPVQPTGTVADLIVDTEAMLARYLLVDVAARRVGHAAKKAGPGSR